MTSQRPLHHHLLGIRFRVKKRLGLAELQTGRSEAWKMPEVSLKTSQECYQHGLITARQRVQVGAFSEQHILINLDHICNCIDPRISTFVDLGPVKQPECFKDGFYVSQYTEHVTVSDWIVHMFINNINARLKMKVSACYLQWTLILNMRTYRVIWHKYPTYRRKKITCNILV